jgi:hypothetical protein
VPKAAPATLAFLFLASTLGCAGGNEPDLGAPPEMARTRSPGEPRAEAHREWGEGEDREAEEREATVRPADPELARQLDLALDRVLAGGDREGVSVLAECGDDGSLTEVRIFGSGVGVWNRGRQFTLEPARVTALLEHLRAVGFSRFQELYGAIEEEVPVPGEGAASALQVVCRVALTIDDVTKQSAQLSDGPRSAELRELADRILALGRGPGATGVAAASLDDGLAKIAEGTLAPEVLSVLLHRKPDARAAAAGEPGFLLRIEGGRATVRPFTSSAGYGAPVTVDLDGPAAARLAERLAEARPGELPLNLYARHYTDLVIEVLDRKVQIQARAFTGMTPTTHGEAQKRFDRIYETLAALAARALQGAGGE